MLGLLCVVGGAIIGGIVGAIAESTDTGKKIDGNLKKNANDWAKLSGKREPFLGLDDKRNS